jgi:hypothetical protein
MGRGQKPPADDELFSVMVQLRSPTDLKSLCSRTGKDDSTLSRWMRSYLAPVVEQDRYDSLWLRGYDRGEPAGSVAVPKASAEKPDKWLNLYLRLGWTYHRETREHYILLQGSASSEPNEDIVPSDFRFFRDLTLIAGCDMQRVDEEGCTNFFRGICEKCQRQPFRAPMLHDLCSPCSQVGSYELAAEKLRSLAVSLMKPFILTYLSYEYHKELMVLMQRDLRIVYEKRELPELNRLWAAFSSRHRKLSLRLSESNNWYPSIEEHLRYCYPKIVLVQEKDATEAIKSALDCARWHQMHAQCPDPIVYALFEDAHRRYETVARPILEKALQQDIR